MEWLASSCSEWVPRPSAPDVGRRRARWRILVAGPSQGHDASSPVRAHRSGSPGLSRRESIALRPPPARPAMYCPRHSRLGAPPATRHVIARPSSRFRCHYRSARQQLSCQRPLDHEARFPSLTVAATGSASRGGWRRHLTTRVRQPRHHLEGVTRG